MTAAIEKPLLESALDYGRRGWRVVPLHHIRPDGTCSCGEDCKKSKGKHPRPLDWQHAATADAKQIEAWWSETPNGNVGVAMGPGSGLVDFETDSPEEEADFVRLFDGDPPVCPTFTSGRGTHRLMRFRPDLPNMGIAPFGKLKVRIGNGEKGAQSVFPPSHHYSGKRYTWLPQCGPDDIDPPEIPDAVVKKLGDAAAKSNTPQQSNGQPEDNGANRKDGRVGQALQAMLGMRVDDANDGSRRLYAAACRCAEMGLGDREAVSAIQAYAMVRPFPRQFSQQDIIKRIRDAEAKVPRIPWGSNDEPIVYRSLTPSELDGEEYAVEYLIPGVLAAGQHCIGGGPHKVLKTLVLACDLGVSLALGGHFLGYFPVTRPTRVAIMSGESGFPVIQENLRRIARAAGTELRYVGNMLISDVLPKFGSMDHIDAMGRFLEDNGIEVAILDPAYLALDGGDASNVFIMGTLLRNMADVFVQHRATMILLHHTTKPAGLDGQPIDLTNLSFAGFREFAAQWTLLNRRTGYEPGSGHHELWFSTGGRLGHSGLWGLDIDEGEYHPNAVRQWNVKVLSADEARQQTRAAAETGRGKDKQARRDTQLQDAKRRIVKTMTKTPAGETKSLIRDTTALNRDIFATAFAGLLETGDIEPCHVAKPAARKAPFPAFRIKDTSHE